jgi:hypothetical protein
MISNLVQKWTDGHQAMAKAHLAKVTCNLSNFEIKRNLMTTFSHFKSGLQAETGTLQRILNI